MPPRATLRGGEFPPGVHIGTLSSAARTSSWDQHVVAGARRRRALAIDLVAREDQLLEVVAAVRAGSGAFVTGESGVGKTALVSAAADRLVAGGAHVSWIVATAASRSMPFGG